MPNLFNEALRNITIIGYGNIAQRVVKQIVTTTRNIEITALSRFANLASTDHTKSTKNINAFIQLDLDENIAEQNTNFDLSNALNNKHVLYFVPPPPQGVLDTRIEKMLNWLLHELELSPFAKNNNLQKVTSFSGPASFTLISTTAVYGDCAGRWINEEAPLNPASARGYRRVHAETCLQAFHKQTSTPCAVLRVPGIYAADRLPVKRLTSNQPALAIDESPYSNRIHADDLANICLSTVEYLATSQTKVNLTKVNLTKANLFEIINASDGHPSTMTEYFNHCANYLGLPKPKTITFAQAKQQFSDNMLSYLSESKRIENHKLLDKLKINLLYPTLRSSLPLGSDQQD